MKTISMSNHGIELAKRKVSDIEGVIRYCQEALDSDLEQWERKEYSKVLEHNIVRLEEAQAHLNRLLGV